jgi:hypothetical protein
MPQPLETVFSARETFCWIGTGNSIRRMITGIERGAIRVSLPQTVSRFPNRGVAIFLMFVNNMVCLVADREYLSFVKLLAFLSATKE